MTRGGDHPLMWLIGIRDQTRNLFNLQLWPPSVLHPLELQGCIESHLKAKIWKQSFFLSKECDSAFKAFYVSLKLPYLYCTYVRASHLNCTALYFISHILQLILLIRIRPENIEWVFILYIIWAILVFDHIVLIVLVESCQKP